MTKFSVAIPAGNTSGITVAAQRFGAALTIALGCSACASLPQPAVVDFAEQKAPAPMPQVVRVAPPNTGSLFQSVSYRPGFEDRRARVVGDTITIQIIENVSASQKSTSTVNRTSSTDAAITPAFADTGSFGQTGHRYLVSQRVLRQGRHRERQHLLGLHHRDGH